MTAPNAELAYRVLDHIDAHPEQWDQGHWVAEAECGTVGCFAGWAVMLSGYMVNDEGTVIGSLGRVTKLDGQHIEDAANVLLGIDDNTVYLYDGLLKRDELGQRVAEIFGPRPGGAA